MALLMGKQSCVGKHFRMRGRGRPGHGAQAIAIFWDFQASTPEFYFGAEIVAVVGYP